MTELKHWFCFVFQASERRRTVLASTYVGYPQNAITKARIEEAKGYADISADAVLSSVSYLGVMTRPQFLGEEELPEAES